MASIRPTCPAVGKGLDSGVAEREIFICLGQRFVVFVRGKFNINYQNASGGVVSRTGEDEAQVRCVPSAIYVAI
jgi:hypothetical protein